MRAITLLALGLGSCALAHEEAVPGAWSIEERAGEDAITAAAVGGTDEEQFYAMRGRVGGKRQLRAYERGDGSLAWSADVAGVCSPPVSVDGSVFCPASALFAFNATSGERLWSVPSDSTFGLVHGTADARRAFAGTLTSALAADAETGEVLWRRGFSGPGWTTVRLRSFHLDGGDLLVSLEAGFDRNAVLSASVVVALDPATGAERWRFVDGDGTTDRGIGRLTTWEGLVLYSDATGGEVVAFDRATRSVVWRVPWEAGFLGSYQPPQVADGVAYWATGDERAYAADARTGAMRWRERGGQGSLVHHEVCGPVLIADVASALRVFRLSDGRYLGERLRDESIGQMAVADGFAYVSTDRGVYALDCASL